MTKFSKEDIIKILDTIKIDDIAIPPYVIEPYELPETMGVMVALHCYGIEVSTLKAYKLWLYYSLGYDTSWFSYYKDITQSITEDMCKDICIRVMGFHFSNEEIILPEYTPLSYEDTLKYATMYLKLLEDFKSEDNIQWFPNKIGCEFFVPTMEPISLINGMKLSMCTSLIPYNGWANCVITDPKRWMIGELFKYFYNPQFTLVNMTSTIPFESTKTNDNVSAMYWYLNGLCVEDWYNQYDTMDWCLYFRDYFASIYHRSPVHFWYNDLAMPIGRRFKLSSYECQAIIHIILKDIYDKAITCEIEDDVISYIDLFNVNTGRNIDSNTYDTWKKYVLEDAIRYNLKLSEEEIFTLLCVGAIQFKMYYLLKIKNNGIIRSIISTFIPLDNDNIPKEKRNG